MIAYFSGGICEPVCSYASLNRHFAKLCVFYVWGNPMYFETWVAERGSKIFYFFYEIEVCGTYVIRTENILCELAVRENVDAYLLLLFLLLFLGMSEVIGIAEIFECSSYYAVEQSARFDLSIPWLQLSPLMKGDLLRRELSGWNAGLGKPPPKIHNHLSSCERLTSSLCLAYIFTVSVA